jgi:putative hemolysin
LIEAEAPIETINDKLNLNLPQGDFETLGGLMIDRLEKIPGPGDQIVESNYRLTVKESGKRKIQSVIVVKINESSNGASNGSSKN